MARLDGEISNDTLKFIINHVFLPPQLPQTADHLPGEKNVSLLNLLHLTAQLFTSHINPSALASSPWPNVVKMLLTFKKSEKSLSAEAFMTSVSEMLDGDIIAVHVTAQNAGLVLTRTANSVLFTSFEASPTSERVTGTIGKLLISYPGPAITVPWSTVTEPNFLYRLADFVEKLKRDVIDAAAGRATKAGESLSEERESADPRFVVHLLTGILRALGSEAVVERFVKRIADEVLWDDAKVPWRRSPLWLVVRVVLRMVLGQQAYKTFMIFFMARVLRMAIARRVDEDVVFVMNAKLARRVYKLRDEIPSYVLDEARVVSDSAYARIEEGWVKAQGWGRRKRWDTKGLNFQRDANITMVRSRAYLKGLRKIKCEESEGKQFIPNEEQRIDATGTKMPDLSQVKKAGARADIMLADFEAWVLNSLDLWQMVYRVDACNYLGDCMEDYMTTAKKVYHGSPLKNSVMILTTMELWMALDRVTVFHCPLLSQYSPELNESFLSALVLPQPNQRTRLSRVQTYIKARRNAALFTGSVFSRDASFDSFSVRSFTHSPALQRLRQQIVQEAEVARNAKKAEFLQKQEEYDKLQVEIGTLSCDYFTHWEEGWTRHDRDCYKCGLAEEANQMRIEVHEWPLPENDHEEAALLFELRCPPTFAIWREATFRILADLCTAAKITPNDNLPHDSAGTYSGLARYFYASILTRPRKLTYTSTTKSFLSTHYRLARLPTALEGICCKNPLKFTLYDRSTDIWTANRPSVIDVRHLCTFRIPDGPYKLLQYTLTGTSHTSNQVLACQYDCPPELQLHEYIAFGLLRSGHRLQWLNMLRELRSRTLTFGTEAVGMLFLQAAWQVGPLGDDGRRESHVEPADTEFGAKMLRELDVMLASVEANWQEVVALQILIVLAVQILAATTTPNVRVEAVRFLTKARTVALLWTRETARMLPKCELGQVWDFQLRVVQMATTCRMTFDVEERFLKVVLGTEEAAAVLVECAHVIHNNVPPDLNTLPPVLRALLDRDSRTALIVEAHLRKLVTSSVGGIDLKPIWNPYERGDRWTTIKGRNERWVCTNTKARVGIECRRVHYNLISGELLVAGQPVGRMPVAYSSHVTYQELFAGKVLDVSISTIPGMEFQTKGSIEMPEVYFALREGQLVIRTECAKDGTMHQLIPRSNFAGEFPTHIIEEHVFWLQLPSPVQLAGVHDSNSGHIELRDRDKPWKVKEGWFISQSYHAPLTKMNLGLDCVLLDIRSPSARMITGILSPLEFPEFIDVRYWTQESLVIVHLPRLKLDFYIDGERRLACKQFPGMTISDKQQIGTFIGLENLLVVQQGQTQSVIVPHGTVVFQRQDAHSKVQIETMNLLRVKYHIYKVNQTLGTLVGNGSLTSQLYKIYLHAVTSNCHPDPLTGRTGTEEALAGLRAATTRSFQVIETDGVDANLFQLILDLTPERVYYPAHLKRMQRVKWLAGLSSIAQHDEFCKGVQEVAEYARTLNVFEGLDGRILWRTAIDQPLVERAAIRNGVFRTEEFGGSIIGTSDDEVYPARDMIHKTFNEARVSYVAGLVVTGQGRLNVHPGLLGVLEGLGDVLGPLPAAGLGRQVLGYDQQWLDPDWASVWIPLYNALRGSSQLSVPFDWMFLLCTMTFQNIELKLLETLLAFATNDAFTDIHPPEYSSYHLIDGYEPNSKRLASVISRCQISFGDSDEFTLAGWAHETERETHQRRFDTFNSHLEHQGKVLAEELQANWPCIQPYIDDEDDYQLYDIPKALQALQPWFESWNRNSEFRRHIAEVQLVLNRMKARQKPRFQIYQFLPGQYTPSTLRNTIRLTDLLTRSAPELPLRPIPLEGNPMLLLSGSPPDINNSLETLLRDFRGRGTNKIREMYARGFEKSIGAFQAQIAPTKTIQVAGLYARLKALHTESKKYMSVIYTAITIQLGPGRLDLGPLHLKGSLMASKAGLWPRISPLLLLQQLATNRAVQLSPDWKAALVSYGTAITSLQRIQRLLDLVPEPNVVVSSDFLKELENTGHINWVPLEKPDWLLMEIEHNFLIRPVQAEVAAAMIAPPGNHNSIMQLCMGEGKTSIIVPIVAASLADKSKLVRVVVLKSLSGQMFQTLVQKLGGLVNRRIFFMPFSRGVAMGLKEIEIVKRLHEECIQSCGILLVQPEHILSFKLLGLEWLYKSTHKISRWDNPGSNHVSSGTNAPSWKRDGVVAQLLLDTQRWLELHSRDILDESDEILNVKHELIYTLGNPTPVENHPDRWNVIQEIFDWIQRHFETAKVSQQDFELERHEQGRFGSIRILNIDAGRELLQVIANKIIDDRLINISFRHFPTDMRSLGRRFILESNLTARQVDPLLRYFCTNKISTNILYLLRGLIAHNILLFALHEKRWKVDYGLDLKRSLLAVPYRAKDSPSGKAEFSHPDVAITLTCLSYYYGGLDRKQLETCFRNLYKSDNPTMQYERWIKGVVLPRPYLNRISGINLDDKKQWEEIIYPTFNYNKAVIDSYLSSVVFPKEAREFPLRLSTSGWDIAALKTHPTTGFSGTNDNRYLLPLSMKQLDSPEQLNTNARVLSFLLQKENSYLATGLNHARLGVKQLLEVLVHHPGEHRITVLLDVGAQVLELRNHQVAETWLALDPDNTALAAVYFNENDELIVLTKDGNIEPLMVSAYAGRLDNCLVYLDEAHTRGTDLKLPRNGRAAVTLGPNLTKDRLVQACMRMRNLGNGHSVLFCAPPEVDRKIAIIARNDNREIIQVRDVLIWCMGESCINSRKLLPIWAKQGIGYQRHLMARNKMTSDSNRFPDALLEKESKSLEQYYGFDRSGDNTIDSYRTGGVNDSELAKILVKCDEFGIKSFHGAPMLGEQERELAHEVECEREIQRPQRVGPANHYLSKEVTDFIMTGTLHPLHRRTHIMPAFNILATTSAKDYWGNAQFPPGLFATADFGKVVEMVTIKNQLTDDFLRPVNWIVSSTVDQTVLVILSSFEVNQLLPLIRSSTHVILHIYAPQVTHSTPSYQLLDLCPIPQPPIPWQPNTTLVDQLNIFAGQLYFSDHKAYLRVCGFLGLHLEETSPEKRFVIGSDGFVGVLDRPRLGMNYVSPFTTSPVTLMRALLGFRRKGQSYITTHMGHVLHGRMLMAKDIETE